jgi:hypothetical protein
MKHQKLASAGILLYSSTYNKLAKYKELDFGIQPPAMEQNNDT